MLTVDNITLNPYTYSCKDEGREPKMKVKTFSINTTDGKRYGLKNASTGDVLHCATAKYKTERGAIKYAIKRGFEIV